MTRHIAGWRFSWIAVAALALGAAWAAIATAEDDATGDQTAGDQISLEEARIFFELNQADGDLGVHVFLDGEDWRELEIVSPSGERLFAVRGEGGFGELGMTELFLEGAEPSFDEVPLQELLDRFPEGDYDFSGVTVDGQEIGGTATFTHAVPDAPEVSAEVGANDVLRIRWTSVSERAPDFPDRPIVIRGYQVIVAESFQVTLPADATSVTLPPEFVASLGAGEHEFEVLAIEEGGNQTITESSFVR